MNSKRLNETEERMEVNTSEMFDALLDGDTEKFEKLLEESTALNAERDELIEQNKEFVAQLGRLCLNEMESRDNNDYVVNKEQAEKFIDVLNFFMELASDCDGRITHLSFEPREEHASLTAEFTVFDVWSKHLQRYREILEHVSALTVDANLSGKVEVSLTVPNVYVHKDEAVK